MALVVLVAGCATPSPPAPSPGASPSTAVASASEANPRPNDSPATAEASATATTAIMTSPVVYETVDDMAARSDAIVSVKIVDWRYVETLPDYSSDDPLINPYAGSTNEPPTDAEMRELGLGTPTTVYSAVVAESFGGDLRLGSEIEIVEVGGIIDGVSYEISGLPALASDLPDLMFLKSTNKNGQYVITGMGQGRFKKSDPGKYVSVDRSVTKLAINTASDMASAKRAVES